LCYLADFGKSVRHLRDYDGDIGAWWADFQSRTPFTKPADGELLEMLGVSACFSAREDGTPQLPFDPRTGVLRSTAHAGLPRVINTDKNPALAAAITELKAESRCATSVQHRRVNYLNSRIEGDHGRLKRILGPKCGFKTPATAYRTLKGMEAMHALRKGQGRIFAYGQSNPDVVIVEKAFAYV
jgi:IS6 family transposase